MRTEKWATEVMARTPLKHTAATKAGPSSRAKQAHGIKDKYSLLSDYCTSCHSHSLRGNRCIAEQHAATPLLLFAGHPRACTEPPHSRSSIQQGRSVAATVESEPLFGSQRSFCTKSSDCPRQRLALSHGTPIPLQACRVRCLLRSCNIACLIDRNCRTSREILPSNRTDSLGIDGFWFQ